MSRCIATYRIYDDQADFRKKATSIAVGMTVGSWTELPQAKREAMQKHLGEVATFRFTRAGSQAAGTQTSALLIRH